MVASMAAENSPYWCCGPTPPYALLCSLGNLPTCGSVVVCRPPRFLDLYTATNSHGHSLHSTGYQGIGSGKVDGASFTQFYYNEIHSKHNQLARIASNQQDRETSMIATAVLGKNFRSLTSRENAKTAIKTHLDKCLSETYINDVITTITTAFEDASKQGIMKREALKETMASKLGDKRMFKFTQTKMDYMIEALESRSIEVYIRPVTKDRDDFQEFLQNTLGDTATVMERAITDEEMWGIYFKEGGCSLLISPIIKLNDETLWIPASTCEIELNNGEKLASNNISRMLIPIMDLAYTKKQDKGAVEVTGPKGSKYPCGQIYTSKKKDQLKPEEKKIELANGYILETFVTITKPKK